MNRDWIRFEPHRERGRLIVLEGDPGAGKTSAACAGGLDIPDGITVPQLDHLSDNSSLPLDTEYPEDWYLDMELLRQVRVRQLLSEGRVVFQDRGIVSTLAFAYANAKCRNEHARLRRFLRRLREGDGFLAPDMVVILHVDVEVGVARRPRFMSSPVYQDWFDRRFLAIYQSFYRRTVPGLLPCPASVIDTTLLPRDCAVDLVLSRALETVVNVSLCGGK